MYKRALTLSAVRVIDFAAFLDRNGSSRALSCYAAAPFMGARERSEEQTSELQSLMRTSYAVFCLTIQRRRVDLCIFHHVLHYLQSCRYDVECRYLPLLNDYLSI